MSAFRLAQRGDLLELAYTTPRLTTGGTRLDVFEVELLRAEAAGDFAKVSHRRRVKVAPGETLVAAILGTLGLQTYGLWLAQTGRPGWFKSFAVEAPLEYWTLGTLQVLLLVVVLASTGYVCRKTTTAS